MTQGRSAPRLEDVAQRAGVSTATVSRCLNAPDKVIESTREKVMQAVRDLGYSPNFGARAMAARRTYTIGAVIPTMENAIFAQGLQAFQEHLRENGFQLLVASSSYNPQVEDQQIRALVARGAEGLLLIGHDRPAATERFLRQRGLPVLVAWSYAENMVFPSVGFDNRAAMQEMAEKVLSLGHRRIAVISASIDGNDRARARLEGVRSALTARGLDASGLAIVQTTYGIEAGAEALQSLLKDRPETTAVICGNDVLAVGVLRAARRLGLSVPQELSVTGFDDIELASVVTPGLTTVHVPHRKMGETAAAALIGMIEGDSAPVSVQLQPGVTERDTLGMPRARAALSL